MHIANTLFWLPLGAASAHIVEEFVWPGGFADWYRDYHPDFGSSPSPRFLFWINAALLFACVSVGIDAPTPFGPPFFLSLVALLGANGIFHAAAVARTRRYSPGVVTGAALYLPLAAFGFAAMLTSGRASIGTAVVAGAIGGSYQYWSNRNHRRRAAAH